ncbi:MAG: pentapeptide repeat-containing protein, partial [Leptolyngbya sp. SIO4C1]|nr:pentapeptide repeat-containing protein [Leptolyngbya sp. SIO4C1]
MATGAIGRRDFKAVCGLLAGLLGILLGLGWMPASAWADPALDSTLLQQRLQTPLRRDGQVVIDLRQLTLDLREADFREQFYQQIQTQWQAESAPVGLDLSDSVVLGDLDLRRLGQRASLSEENPYLPPAAVAQLRRDRNRLAQIGRLSQSLLLQPASSSPQINLFQGPLKLVHTTVTGQLIASNLYFLNVVEGAQAVFTQAADWSDARFIRAADFADAEFQQESSFSNSLFFSQVRFNSSQFRAATCFQKSQFRASAYFNQAQFVGDADFSRSDWQNSADFARTQFLQPVTFAKAAFAQ